VSLLGDNLAGNAVDFFNPASDALAVVQLLQMAKEQLEKDKDQPREKTPN